MKKIPLSPRYTLCVGGVSTGVKTPAFALEADHRHPLVSNKEHFVPTKRYPLIRTKGHYLLLVGQYISPNVHKERQNARVRVR